MPDEMNRPLSEPRKRWALDDRAARKIVYGADLERDITEEWGEETDPENEFGECAWAFFKARWEYEGVCYCDLTGISITEGRAGETTETFYDAEGARHLLGPDVVRRIEDRISEEETENG